LIKGLASRQIISELTQSTTPESGGANCVESTTEAKPKGRDAKLSIPFVSTTPQCFAIFSWNVLVTRWKLGIRQKCDILVQLLSIASLDTYLASGIATLATYWCTKRRGKLYISTLVSSLSKERYDTRSHACVPFEQPRFLTPLVFLSGPSLQLLNTPEKVPFRLTQNIIDGMGPTGIEGTFTKAAEETLTVLKRNSNALLTILSAIVSDPLYRWSVSPVKARQRQRLSEKDEEDSGGRLQERRKSVEADDSKSGKDESKPGTETNEAAAHAITRISEKLQGYEDGTSGEQQSVEGQVQLLVNSAKDQDNLSEMYFGWAPWM